MSPPPVPAYPVELQTQMFHAARFACALRVLHEDASADDPALLWLEGRAEEVTVFTSDVLAAWSAGELSTRVAEDAIDGYLHALHATLEGWYGAWYAPSCCGPLASGHRSGAHRRADVAGRRPDSLSDTVADVPVPALAQLLAG